MLSALPPLFSTVTASDFIDVHAKLARAEEHMNELSEAIDSFVAGDSYARFEPRFNPIDESYSVIFHESELPASASTFTARAR